MKEIEIIQNSKLKTQTLADALFEIGAIKFGAFRLKLHQSQPDAPLSPIYVNLRLLRSYPAVLGLVCEQLKAVTDELEFDVLADIPTAITPVAAVLGYITNRPLISPRKEAKTYGLGVAIDGDYQAGQTALVLDDVIAKGDSKFEAIATLEQAGLKVRDIVLVVDREQGGVTTLTERGYQVHALATLSQLLDRYLSTGAISQVQYDAVKEYQKF